MVSSPSLFIVTKQLSVISLLFVCVINGIVIILKTFSYLGATFKHTVELLSLANVTMGRKEKNRNSGTASLLLLFL